MPNVWIRQSLLEQMISEVEFYSPLETGGSFFGYAAANNDVVITHLVAAGPNAKRTPNSFEPDQTYQLSEMEKLFYEKDSKLSYIGDWHSHPNNSPALSRKDEKTLLNIALVKESQCPYPIMLIIGFYPDRTDINCVRFLSGRKLIWPFGFCKYEHLNLIVD